MLIPSLLGLAIVALAVLIFLLGFKLGGFTMADFSKLSASIDRAISQYQAAQATIAAGDQQSDIDALTAKIDAAFPAPALVDKAPSEQPQGEGEPQSQ